MVDFERYRKVKRTKKNAKITNQLKENVVMGRIIQDYLTGKDIDITHKPEEIVRQNTSRSSGSSRNVGGGKF